MRGSPGVAMADWQTEIVAPVIPITIANADALRMPSFSALRYLGTVVSIWIWLAATGWLGLVLVDQANAGTAASFAIATFTVGLGDAIAGTVALKLGWLRLRTR